MINDSYMGRRANWRFFALLAVMIMLAGVLTFSVIREKTTCMQVPIMRESDYAKLTVYEPINLSPWIYQNGENAAIDTDTSTIYISQNISSDTHLADLPGIIELQRSDYQLYFAPDEMFKNLKTAVETGHAFKLLAINNNAYMAYDVVFTSLPIVKIVGYQTSEVDEDGRSIFEGNMCMWTANDPEVGRYSVKNSLLQFHIRGATSSQLEKKSWKLALKDSQGENNHLSLLNMGSDDDWVLNSMNLDDTKIREKTIIDMWNQYIYSYHNGYPMSQAGYVEVVINNQYQGLYLLQRRIDSKYLSLDRQSDLLFKCLGTYEDLGIRVNYVTKYSPYDIDKTYEILEKALGNVTGYEIDLDGFIDTTLFIQYFALLDNCGYKNMYYVIRLEDDNTYRMYYVPWDTDMSMGLRWTSFFAYDYEYTISRQCRRMELPTMQASYPELNSMISKRWKELRNNAFTMDTIFDILGDNNRLIRDSGAYDRDVQKWGLFYGDDDTYEAIRQWCYERTLYLDEIYGS